MTDRPAWLEIDCPLGDTRLPIRAAVRVDGLVEVEVGEPGVFEYETICDYEQLDALIELLSIVRDCARKTEEHSDE